MATKEQFMVSVDAPDRDRMDALRIVTGISRAEVGRRALLDGGIRALEAGQIARLTRMYALATDLGYGSRWPLFVRAYVKAHRQGGPTLEEMEDMRQDDPAELIRTLGVPGGTSPPSGQTPNAAFSG